MRRLLQPVWFVLAVIFLVEAWLWDHLEPIVARIVALIPLERIKLWIADRVDSLSPTMTLIVFIVPVLPLFPLKLAGLWLLAHKYWVSALVVIVFGKLLGLGVTAFIFDVTKPKLMQLGWFRVLYRWVLKVRDWAHDLVDPVRVQIRRWLRHARSTSSTRFVRIVQRLRRRAHAARQS
jgi:hypothetical protein